MKGMMESSSRSGFEVEIIPFGCCVPLHVYNADELSLS